MVTTPVLENVARMGRARGEVEVGKSDCGSSATLMAKTAMAGAFTRPSWRARRRREADARVRGGVSEGAVGAEDEDLRSVAGAA